jgi:hypothetical protein
VETVFIMGSVIQGGMICCNMLQCVIIYYNGIFYNVITRIDQGDEGFEEDDRQLEKHDAGCVSQSSSTFHAATAENCVFAARPQANGIYYMQCWVRNTSDSTIHNGHQCLQC